jgi:hypothetical protein
MSTGMRGRCIGLSYHIPCFGYVIVQKPELNLNDIKRRSLLGKLSGEGRISVLVEGMLASLDMYKFYSRWVMQTPLQG